MLDGDGSRWSVVLVSRAQRWHVRVRVGVGVTLGWVGLWKGGEFRTGTTHSMGEAQSANGLSYLIGSLTKSTQAW